MSAEPQPDAAVEDETLQRCPCIDCPLPAGCALRQQKRVVFRLAYVEQIFCIREQADLADRGEVGEAADLRPEVLAGGWRERGCKRVGWRVVGGRMTGPRQARESGRALALVSGSLLGSSYMLDDLPSPTH